MPRYRVTQHRLVTIEKLPPPKGGGFLGFCIAVAIFIGLVHACGSSAPSPVDPFPHVPGSIKNEPSPRGCNPLDIPPRAGCINDDIPPPDVAKPEPVGSGRVVASMDGNRCRVDALANGEKFDFLIDTGASGIWFDGPVMARRLGFDPAKLNYDETFIGGGRAASVRLREFRIGGFALNDVAAYIDKGGTVYGGRGPLFGMSILKGIRLEVVNGGCMLVLPQSAPAKPASTPAPKWGDDIALTKAERVLYGAICPHLSKSDFQLTRTIWHCDEIEGVRQ